MSRTLCSTLVLAVACSGSSPTAVDAPDEEAYAVSLQPPAEPPSLDVAVAGDAPEVQPAQAAPPPAEGALEVELDGWCETAGCPVALQFDRPVVDDLAAPAPDVTFEPPQRGTWAWTAPDRLEFTPDEGSMWWGHRVEVHVPAIAPLGDSSAAMAGYADTVYVPEFTAAGKVASWPVELGKPRFVGFVNGFTMELGSAPLILLYDQPVSLNAVKADLRITDADGHELDDKVWRPSDVSYVLREELDAKHLVAVRVVDPPADGESITFHAPERPGQPGGTTTAWSLRMNRSFSFDGFAVDEEEDWDPKEPVPLSTRFRFDFSNGVHLDELDDKLVIDPAPLSRRVSGWGESAWVDVELEPGVVYDLRAPELRDVLGNQLRKPLVVQLRSEDLPPELHTPSLPTVTEAGRATLDLRARNLGELAVTTYALPDAGAFARAVEGDAGRCADLGATTELATTTAPSTDLTQSLDALAVELPRAPGLFCVEVAADGLGSEATGALRQRALVQSTDLAVTAKVSDGAVFAWVTRLGDPAPVPGAAVSVLDARGRAIGTGSTDKDGVATVTVREATAWGVDEPLFLAATTGADASITRLQEDRLSKAWQFGLTAATAEPLPLDAALFTERGTYRPGESPHVAVVAGPARAGQTATLTVDDARGQQIATRDLMLDRYGAADVVVPLADGASVGQYVARVSVGERSISHRFRVEEYRIPTFQVEVDGPEAWQRGEPVDALLSAAYLHGGSLDGREVRWSVQRAPVSFAPRAFPRFLFSLGSSAELAGVIASGEARLDGTGKRPVGFTPEHPSSAGPMRYTVEATVTDVDRQAYAGRASRTVHPADFYVGAQPPLRTVLGAGEVLEVPIVAVTPEGTAIPGVQVRARLERVDHHQTTRVGSHDAVQTLNREVAVPTDDCTLTTTDTASTCRFELPTPGVYRVRAWARDTHHRDVQAGFEVTATGDGPTAWPRFDRERITLTADKPAYAPGDVAHLVAQTPFPRALALLTLERDGVMEHRVLHIDGDTPSIDVPITGEHAPNVYASVLLVRGREHDQVDATGFETGAPALRVGYAELAVDTAEQRLAVDVSPTRNTASPGDEVSVDLRLADHTGAPVSGQAVVMVVDEAVLGLTGFRTPEPVASLYPERPLGVRTADGRQELPHARRDRHEILFPGGDGGEGGGQLPANMLRSLFESTAFFDGAVPIGADGAGRVTFRVPDNTTTFRVMAVAVDQEGRAGSGDAPLVVKLPLMVQAVLPRFGYPGDQMTLGAIAFNGTEAAGEVALTFDFDGVEATGQARQTVTVRADSSERVDIPVTFGPRGDALVRITAQMGEESDAIEVSLPILEPGAARKTVVSRSVAGTETLSVDLPEDMVPGTARLELVASSTALTELKDAVGYLMGYPNGCIEQTTSRAYPLVVLEDLLPEIGVEVDQAQLHEYAEAGVRRILSFQTEGGGLSYWPGGTEPHAFATSFGLTALLAAKDRGYDVPDASLDRMADYLESALRKGDVTEDIPHGNIADGDTRALFVMTLGRMGRPQPAMISHLWEERAKLTPFGLSFLGIAAAELDPNHPLLPPILAAVKDASKQSPTEAWFEGDRKGGYSMDSPMRSHATALLAYAVSPGAAEMDGKLLAGLLGRRQGGLWGNTQENVFGIMGVHALTQGGGGDGPAPDAALSLDGQPIDPASLEVVSRRVRRYTTTDVAPGEHSFTVRHAGGPPLNVNLRATYDVALTPENRKPIADGIEITREVTTVDGAPVDLAAVPLGSLVAVRLHVTTEAALNYVAIADKLPAGLEALNASLETTERVSTGALSDAEKRAQTYLSYRELRDERVAFYADELPAGTTTWTYIARATTAGTFLRPAADAEAMYEPTIRGATAIDAVTIR